MKQGDVCVITGGSGFIGSNLAIELVKRGMRVRVLDDFSTGRRVNLAPVISDVEIFEGDMRLADGVANAIRGAAYVFHQGAMTSVFRSVKDPRGCHATNLTGTLNVLIAARDAGAERVVYASSAAVYGEPDTLPVHEGLPTRPASPYGATKLAGEAYASAFHATHGLSAVSLRYFNVFGPRQNPGSEYASVVPKFVSQTLAGEPATIFGDGRQTRDFTFVGDVVRANILAAEAPDEVSGRAFNVAGGAPRSVGELLETIQRIVPGDHPAPVHAPPRPGEVRESAADVTRSREELGYEPSASFEEGLRETIEWVKTHEVLGPA